MGSLGGGGWMTAGSWVGGGWTTPCDAASWPLRFPAGGVAEAELPGCGAGDAVGRSTFTL